MRVLILAAALAVGAPAVASADADVVISPPGTGEVAVYRGTEARVASPVTVRRGSAIRPAYLVEPPAPEPAVEALGGRRIWLVCRPGHGRRGRRGPASRRSVVAGSGSSTAPRGSSPAAVYSTRP